jgi:hypothetical protein
VMDAQRSTTSCDSSPSTGSPTSPNSWCKGREDLLQDAQRKNGGLPSPSW